MIEKQRHLVFLMFFSKITITKFAHVSRIVTRLTKKTREKRLRCEQKADSILTNE